FAVRHRILPFPRSEICLNNRSIFLHGIHFIYNLVNCNNCQFD
ncbi:unnamed protein product, partial [Tenebrio molitor]